MSATARPLHTTTVRYDADLWTRICLLAQWLGIPKAELIRAATREYIARLEAGEQLLGQAVGETVVDHERRLHRVELVVIGGRY